MALYDPTDPLKTSQSFSSSSCQPLRLPVSSKTLPPRHTHCSQKLRVRNNDTQPWGSFSSVTSVTMSRAHYCNERERPCNARARISLHFLRSGKKLDGRSQKHSVLLWISSVLAQISCALSNVPCARQSALEFSLHKLSHNIVRRCLMN